VLFAVQSYRSSVKSQFHIQNRIQCHKERHSKRENTNSRDVYKTPLDHYINNSALLASSWRT